MMEMIIFILKQTEVIKLTKIHIFNRNSKRKKERKTTLD